MPREPVHGSSVQVYADRDDPSIKDAASMIKDRIVKVINIVAFIIWLIVLFPVLLLQIGFSSGRILSPSALFTDIVRGDPLAWYSVVTWLTVLYGVYLIGIILKRFASR